MKGNLTMRARLAAAAVLLAVALAPVAEAQQQRPQATPRAQQQAPAQRPAAAPAARTPSDAMPDVSARQTIVLDYHTGFVMFERNADERMPPSSMSKVMTAYLVFEAVKAGKLGLEDMLPVSERAWRMQGSKMFVPLNGRVKAEDLIRGMIVQSGNDACIVLAEALAGSEEAFAEQMNAEARRMGLNGSNFRNATGWPDPDHYMTARDLATLARRVVDDHPEFYKYYRELNFTYGKDERTGRDITQGNRNPLLYKNIGADGIKTGHTEQAGYGLTASASSRCSTAGRRCASEPRNPSGWSTGLSASSRPTACSPPGRRSTGRMSGWASKAACRCWPPRTSRSPCRDACARSCRRRSATTARFRHRSRAASRSAASR
jgi:D-alanyl-D-alanine carboxypeptidase (penicillin-binding protein 5/6)